MRKWLGLLMMVAFAVGALGGAIGGCAGITPQQQLALIEADLATALGIYEIWSEGESPEDLAKLTATWEKLRASVLTRLEIYLENKGIDRSRVADIRGDIAKLDAATGLEVDLVDESEKRGQAARSQKLRWVSVFPDKTGTYSFGNLHASRVVLTSDPPQLGPFYYFVKGSIDYG